MRLYSFGSQGDHEILGVRRAGVSDAVLVIRGDIGHRARSQTGGATGDSNLDRAFADQKDFFVRMVVRRMRHGARRKVGLMYFYLIAGVSFPFQDTAK